MPASPADGANPKRRRRLPRLIAPPEAPPVLAGLIDSALAVAGEEKRMVFLRFSDRRTCMVMTNRQFELLSRIAAKHGLHYRELAELVDDRRGSVGFSKAIHSVFLQVALEAQE